MLLADIGGTHARFAWADGAGGYCDPLILKVVDYPSLDAALAVALAGRRAERALLALAGPVRGSRCRLTNSHWGEIDAERLGIARVTLLNDLEAQAWLLPYLTPADGIHLGGGIGDSTAPMLLVSPGTGLGVALHVPGHGPVATEGGHATLAGADAQEDAVLARLRARFGHASAERALCGAGFGHLAEAMGCDDQAAVEAMYLALLAGFCGSLALATGARGGVCLSGSILNARRAGLQEAAFHRRFVAKGRFAGWLGDLPLRLIVAAEPGLAGEMSLTMMFERRVTPPCGLAGGEAGQAFT